MSTVFSTKKRKNTIKSLTKIQNKYKVDRLQYKYNTKINIHRKYKDKVNKDTGKKLAQWLIQTTTKNA